MGSRPMTETEVTRWKIERRTREHEAGPGSRTARPEFRIEPQFVVGGDLRADQSAVRIGLSRIVPTAHIDFDVAEAVLGEVCLQLLECVLGRHVRHQAHVDLGYGAMRQDGLAAWARIAADEPLDIDRGL